MAKPRIELWKQDGCPACAQTLPIVERLAAHYSGCVETRIRSVEDEYEESERLGIEAVPDLLSYDGEGRPLFRLTGDASTLARVQRLYIAVARTVQACEVKVLDDES